MSEPLVVNDRVTIPGDELAWTAARAGGPGGQNVNKVASKVELRFDLVGSRALDAETKSRLRALAGSRVTTEGALVVVSQRTRDQPRNLEDAREKLRALVLLALERPKARRPTKPSKSARARRMDDKRAQGAKKRDRRSVADD